MRSCTVQLPSAASGADVAGAEPAVLQRLGGRGRVAASSRANSCGPRSRISPGVPGGTGRPSASTIRASTPRSGLAGAGRTVGASDPRIDRDRRRLGAAVDLQHRDAAGRERRRHRRLHHGRAGGDGAQARRGRPRRKPGCAASACSVAGTSTVRRRAVRARWPRSVASGSKRGCSVTVAPASSAGTGLDVEAADMEQRQHGQHVVGVGQPVHVAG